MGFSRRNFLEVMVGGSASLLVPEAFAQTMPGAPAGTAASSSLRVPVISDMTANLVMEYIANQAGVDLGKNTTDDTRKYATVEFGKNSPKTIWVGTNLDYVVLSDQIAWRTTEKGVEVFKKKMKVERTPSNVDYIFPGDTLVFNLSKMNESDRAKAVAKFGQQNVDVKRVQLAAYTAQKYGKHIADGKAAIVKLDVDGARKERYQKMDELAFMVREVAQGVGQVMYKPLADQGVKFVAPVEYAAKDGIKPAAEPGTHREVADIGKPMIYFGAVYQNPIDSKFRNIGLSPNDGNREPHLRYAGSIDQLKEILGERDFAQAMERQVPARQISNTPDGFNRVYTPISLDSFMKLGDNHLIVRAGDVTNDVNPKTWGQERGYAFRRAAVQAVNPGKG